jgi:predicted nucleotidyltransferase/HEPN domain-containing protein
MFTEHLLMKNSPAHLPQHKQDELAQVVEEIHAASHDVEMVILFGSYARGDWKEAAALAPDRKSGHVSDYDMLVVTGDGETAYDTVLWEDVSLECLRLGLSAQVRIIAHDVEFVNNRLAEGQYFFKDVEREGCLLYDSGEVTLAQERQWTPAERKRIAQGYYDHWFNRANDFWFGFERYFETKRYSVAAFNLHQCAEAAYKMILLVLTNYCPHEHYLGVLGLMAEEQDARFSDVFPRDTPADRKRFKRLDYAYIGARYDPGYRIAKEDLDYLSGRVRRLLELTETVCQARLERLGSGDPGPGAP